MKITHGTAIYTGGGFYSVIGKVDDGNYFVGNNDWCCVVDADPRYKDEFSEWNFFHIEWLEDHDIHADVNEIYPMFKEFCERLDAEEKGITKGWDELSNYYPGEVTEMIDFSYFDEWKDERNQPSLSGSDMADVITEMIKNDSNIECDDDDSPMIVGVDEVWSDENVVRINMKNGDEFIIGVCRVCSNK